jgi:hypothetical protein
MGIANAMGLRGLTLVKQEIYMMAMAGEHDTAQASWNQVMVLWIHERIRHVFALYRIWRVYHTRLIRTV